MWKCTNCSHLELAQEKPSKCPVCGAEAGKLVEHQVDGIKGEKTLQNLKMGFVAESQASVRNRAFAMKADQEELPQMAALFRAIAQSEAVHAFNHLRFFGGISDTQDNLQSAFERENLAADSYPQLIKDANDENNEAAASIFGFVRDVEKEHAKLYKGAMDHMVSEEETEYYICSICGHIEDGYTPDECPVCGAPKEKFTKTV
ncbi:MAG: rubrerythrin family protein [Planctomycetes bacterium]|nr:rubrerythrin family protein [Planctomycetota bacterium]